MAIPMEGGTLYWLGMAARTIGWRPRPNPFCGPICGLWAGKDWLTPDEIQESRRALRRYAMAVRDEVRP